MSLWKISPTFLSILIVGLLQTKGVEGSQLPLFGTQTNSLADLRFTLFAFTFSLFISLFSLHLFEKSEGIFCDNDDDGKDPWSCVLFVLPRQSFLCPDWIKWIWTGEVWVNKKRDILAHQKVLRHTFASCSSTQQHRFPTSCSFGKHVHTFIGRGDFDKCLYIQFSFFAAKFGETSSVKKHECSVKIVLFLVHHSTRFRDPEV